MAETLEFDPVSEDATNTPLALTYANGYLLREHSYPDPPVEPIWASNIDTEGARLAGLGRGNREITIKVDPFGDTAAAFRTAQNNLDKKLGKLQREGGTLKRTLPNGDVIVFDVLTVMNAERQFGITFDIANTTEDGFTLVCLPFGRGTVQTFTATQETSLPVHRFLAASVKGDVPALGKVTVTDLAAQSQFWAHWGIRQRHYSNDADNALFYEAEGRTVLGGATVVTGTAPASGGASNNVVRQATLTPNYQSMLSTQATGGGSHLEHIGIYEFWARVFMPATNTGEVSIALNWAEADFRRYTSNSEVSFTADHQREGQWILVNLGQVFLGKVAQGLQRWEGRIMAKSTIVGDDLDIDCFWLRPIEEGNGTARGLVSFEYPSSFLARDEFDQTAGTLAGKTAPVGGIWAAVGDTDVLSVETTGKTAQRTAVSDSPAPVGRIDSLPVALTNAVVQVDFKSSVASPASADVQLGVAARVDRTLSSAFRASYWTLTGQLIVHKVIGGVPTNVGILRTVNIAAGTWYTIRLLVAATGVWHVWFFSQGGQPGVPLLSGIESVLATGGTLATGEVGISDRSLNAIAATRNYDNFMAFAPGADAAMFASQSLELRHDRVIREDSGGTIWAPVSDYSGDYLLIPPTGMEGRTSELLVKASRTDPEWGTDPGIDDIEVDLEITPRYLKVPSP